MKFTTKHASNSPVTFVTHERFAVLFFLPSCCVNSLIIARVTRTLGMRLQEWHQWQLERETYSARSSCAGKAIQLMERLTVRFIANGIRKFVPRDQVSLNFCFALVWSIIIVLDCFEQHVFFFETFLTWIRRLPFAAVKVTLNLSNISLKSREGRQFLGNKNSSSPVRWV